LKIITRTEDPTRHYTSMRAAAEAGLAPRVWYTDIEDKISITDFVETEPLPLSEALIRLPASLRTLHSLPPFGRAPYNTTCTFLINKGATLDGYLQKFQAANILPKAENEEFFARYAELAAVYPHDDAEMVSSHNDLVYGRVHWEQLAQNVRQARYTQALGIVSDGVTSARSC
jgi:hypothetical protein